MERTFENTRVGDVNEVISRLPSDEKIAELAEFLEAFGDFSRIKILLVLQECELCPSEISSITGLSMHHENDIKRMKELTAIIASAILFITGIIFEKSLHSYPLVEYGLFLTAYAIAGWKIVWKAVKNVKRGIIFDENTLMTIATVGAIAIHEMPEAVAVMLF